MVLAAEGGEELRARRFCLGYREILMRDRLLGVWTAGVSRGGDELVI